MARELAPIDVTDTKDLRQLAEEVERTGLSRRLQRGGVDVAVIVPVKPRPTLADPDNIWANYDVDAVRLALKESAGALQGVDRNHLLKDIYEQREQDSKGRPA
ncbi:MAG: hypothetical protein AB7R89_00810 [Dehalococcoidia bacterium]